MHHSFLCAQLLWYVLIALSIFFYYDIIWLFLLINPQTDTMGNKGAYIILNGKEMKPQYEVYEAVPHPNGKLLTLKLFFWF